MLQHWDLLPMALQDVTSKREAWASFLLCTADINAFGQGN
jgi:hypothetical protein